MPLNRDQRDYAQYLASIPTSGVKAKRIPLAVRERQLGLPAWKATE